MGWLAKFFLFLFFFTLPQLWWQGNSKFNWCGLIASSNEIVKFGKEGEEGMAGRDGEKGRDSENITIFADGSPLNLNLSGQPGLTGGDGQNGADAACDSQPADVNYNLQGSSGGDGGTGGNGGDGGDGGSLTIYATNRDFLRQIYVQASGGKGGEPGSGGFGGKGCQCPQPYWSVETCSGDRNSSNYFCSTSEYFCLNGEAGQNGRSGRPGREGNLGSLTLINSDRPLAPDRISASATMVELKNRGFNLSKNVWETKTGAASLFASGSAIADRYLELLERIENSVVLIWNAPQPFQPFSDEIVNLTLQEDRSVRVTFPQELWLETNLISRDKVTEIFVFNAIKAEEATQLESKGLSGSGLALELELVDRAQRSDLISTRFYLKYAVSSSGEARYRQVSDYTTRYEGEVPPQFVRYGGNRFIIDIGQLPIAPQYLEPDKAVQIQIEAVRSLGDYSASQNIVVRDILGPFN